MIKGLNEQFRLVCSEWYCYCNYYEVKHALSLLEVNRTTLIDGWTQPQYHGSMRVVPKIVPTHW